MKLVLKYSKRLFAMVLVLVLLVSGAVQTLLTSAQAAGTSDNLYSFLVTNCYSDQPLAKKILESGALIGAGSITINYPESDLLSVSDGKLNAKSFRSGLNGASWVPDTYTIDGEKKSFNGGTSVALTKQGSFHVDVTYRLDTGISGDELNLPATLAAEAASQVTVLNHLISEDKPYMGYMDQLPQGQLNTMHGALDPSYTFIKLLDNEDKNTAVKNSFRDVIEKMSENCYENNGTLRIYSLLRLYRAKGLIYYYQKSERFQKEISLFSQYLDELLAPEVRDGVELTEKDKETAIEALLVLAKQYNMIDADVNINFVELKDNVGTARDMLTPPNKAINLSDSANLKVLVEILEKEAIEKGESVGEEGVVQWKPLVSSYGDTLTLFQTVSTDLNNTVENPGGDSSGDTGDTPDDGGSSGDTGDTPSDGGSGGDTGYNPGGSYSDHDSVRYVVAEGALKNAVENAHEGGRICVLSTITMTEDIPVNTSLTITGADNLEDTGYVLTLTNTNASIVADGPLNVASGVEGYVPVKTEDTNTYTLTEVTAPKASGEVAGSKSEKLSDTRYLYLDLDPANGMTLDALHASISFHELTDYTVKFSIEGNNGSGLVKTADRLVVTVSNDDGKRVAQISYVVIVMGDTNCNGKVNTSDAAVTKSISMGKECALEVRMAADVNFSGTLETPKVNSSDVSHIMAKWFAWDLKKYVSNLK